VKGCEGGWGVWWNGRGWAVMRYGNNRARPYPKFCVWPKSFHQVGIKIAY
jgi:hypothetical protein